MARRPRVEFPGAIHHVTGRGNAGVRIYRDQADRVRFLEMLAHIASRRGWLCHAYCLMDNHYHLLLETTRSGLGAGMQWLNGAYAQGFNRRGGRSGHLFQGRYYATLVERDAHLVEAARYVVLNPVRASLCAGPGEWAWSSYRGTAGDDPPSAVLTTELVLSLFGRRPETAQARYRAFVADGI
jgi:REP element-mobilizing transposase RayT